MLNQDLRNDVEEEVRNFMTQEKIDNYKLEIEGQSESGENYLGEVIFFKITTSDNEDQKIYNLIMKTSKRNDSLREKIEKAYHHELTMYEEIFPAFRQFIADFKSKIEFGCVPKVYWTSHKNRKETLILENLKSTGFELHDRTKPWDLKHSLLVMKNYGEYHGISLALSDKEPKLFENLTEKIPNLTNDFTKDLNVREFYKGPLKEAMAILKKAGRSDLVPKFDKIFVEIPEISKNEAEEGDRIVISHGDCWNNNFLFQYENGNPVKVRFIDFQLTNRNSPVSDLSYNIYATCDKNCLDNFDLLLKTYHDSLSNTVADFGCNPNELLSYNKLLEHWKKYSKIGLINAPILLKFALVAQKDVQKTSENENFDSVLSKMVVTNQDEYNRRITDIMVHYGERFL